MEKDFFKLMNNDVFGKTLKNVRKHRDIKLVTTEGRRDCLVSEPYYYTTTFFNLLAIEMKKTKITMNKPVHLGLSILDLIKTVMYDFWYDYIKTKYGKRRNLCHMDTDSFIAHIKYEIFIKIFQKMSKKNSTFQITKEIDHYL